MAVNSFNAPVFEISWDEGKTWSESYTSCCGPGMLMRIVAPDGKLLWQGRGTAIKKTCGGCDGAGVRDYYEFVIDPPSLPGI
jgi:hypothetical protein